MQESPPCTLLLLSSYCYYWHLSQHCTNGRVSTLTAGHQSKQNATYLKWQLLEWWYPFIPLLEVSNWALAILPLAHLHLLTMNSQLHHLYINHILLTLLSSVLAGGRWHQNLQFNLQLRCKLTVQTPRILKAIYIAMSAVLNKYSSKEFIQIVNR